MLKKLIGGKWLLLTRVFTKRVFSLLLLFSTLLFANENAQYAGSFTRLGLGARSIAMGNTGVAAEGYGYSFYYNPALAGLHQNTIFSNSFTFLSRDRHAYFIGLSTKIPPAAGLSLAWLKTGTADFANYNSIGSKSGVIEQSAHAIYGSFSRQFSDKFSIGITLKVLLEYISSPDFSYESSGVGADIGLFYRIADNLSVGAVYKDIGSNLKANTQDIFEFGGTTVDKLPKLLRVGAFYNTPIKGLNAAYDFEISSSDEFTNHFGLEAVHDRNISARLGIIDFKSANNREMQFFAGAGFIFNLYKYDTHLDYTFISSKEAEGSSHLYSFEIYF